MCLQHICQSRGRPIESCSEAKPTSRQKSNTALPNEYICHTLTVLTLSLSFGKTQFGVNNGEMSLCPTPRRCLYIHNRRPAVWINGRLCLYRQFTVERTAIKATLADWETSDFSAPLGPTPLPPPLRLMKVSGDEDIKANGNDEGDQTGDSAQSEY